VICVLYSKAVKSSLKIFLARFALRADMIVQKYEYAVSAL